MAGFDRIVAVDEAHNLPPETRSALLNSEQFGTSAVQHVTDRSKAPGAAFQTHLQTEVTEEGHATHDALMRIIEESAEEPTGALYEAIRAQISASEDVSSVFISAHEFLPSLGTPALANIPNLVHFNGLKAYTMVPGSRTAVMHGGTILPPSWEKYDVAIVYVAAVSATPPNNITRWTVSANALMGNVEEFYATITKTDIPIGDSVNITEAIILEDVVNSPGPQIIAVFRETISNLYNNNIHLLGVRIIKAS